MEIKANELENKEIKLKKESVNDTFKSAYKEGSKHFISKNNDFLILTKTKKTVEYIFKVIDNYPHKYVVFSNNIQSICLSMIETLHYYVVNYNSIKYRNKYITEYIVKISLLDDIIGFSFNKKLISYKKFRVICNFIIELRKMSYGLLKNEKV